MSQRRRLSLNELKAPAHLLPTEKEIRQARQVDKVAHPILRTLQLPPLNRLPGVATQIQISPLETTPGISYSQYLYETREEVYRDAIALVRGHLWREYGADKVERTKWVARRLPEKEGLYSFDLPIVQLLVTVWRHVEPFSGGERKREYYVAGEGYYVPAEEARAFLWYKYGLNLSMMSAYEEAAEDPARYRDPRRGLTTPSSTAEAMAFFGITAPLNRLAGRVFYAPRIELLYLWALKDAPGFVADYVSLNDLAVIVGHIERGLFDFLKGRDPRKLGPNNPALSSGIRFSAEKTSEAALAIYADGPEIEPKATAPLPGGLKGKPLDTFCKLLRLRCEIREIDASLMILSRRALDLSNQKSALPDETLLSEDDLLGVPGEAEPIKLLHDRAAHSKRLLQERAALEGERTRKSVEVRPVYRDLLRTLAHRREHILGQHNRIAALRTTIKAANNQWTERKERFVDIPSPLEGLPAHMALLPAGLELPFHSATDPFGRAILKVVRPTQGRDRQYLLRLYVPEEQGLHAPFIERMAMIFGKRQWLLAQGLTAFAQLYRERGGYDERGRSVRITIPEWCRAMRPGDSTKKRIAAKGTNGLFGSDVKTVDAFYAFFDAAQAIHFPDPRDRKHTVAGLITITGYGTEPGRGDYVHAAMNPDLYDLMVGEGQRPMFMVTNAEAMLSYREQELSYLPAAQFALELLARQNLYNRETATLSSPTGDGFARATLMSKFGLLQGPRERPTTLQERFDRLCKGLQNKGVVASIERDGRERDDWRATKLHITMSEDYKIAYNLNKMLHRLAREEKLLEVPFAPPKRRV